MAENLLWPTKLKQPPKLLIDPEVMFTEELFGRKHPLVTIEGSSTTRVRYIGLIQNGFMIGFVSDVYSGKPEYENKRLALPFQDISTEILEYRCHGWSRSDVDQLSTPDRTEVKATLRRPISIVARPSMYINDKKPLFKMEGEVLEDNGSGPQFSSNRAYFGILYNTTGDSFVENLQPDFPDMLRDFPDPSSSTLAIETVVKVIVNSTTDPNGFKVGVVSS